MITLEDVAAPIAMLAGAFERAISKAGIKAYQVALSDLTPGELTTATEAALKTCRFMPSPAELRELAGRRHPDASAQAVLAWSAVRRAIDVHDYLVATIDFGPLVNAVIRNLGGWDTLCTATLPELDNPGWLRKRFEEVYAALAPTPAGQLQGEPLPGKLPPNYRGAGHAVISIAGEKPRLRLPAPSASSGPGGVFAALAEEKSA